MSNQFDPTYLLPDDERAVFVAVDGDLLNVRLVRADDECALMPRVCIETGESATATENAQK